MQPNLCGPILVVDDDPDDCLLLQEALRECRVEGPVAFAHDGEEALAYLQRCLRHDLSGACCPQLILLDLNMPRMDGRETLRELQREPRLRHIPVVILSTSCDAEEIAATRQAGARAFFSKPASYQGLLDLIGSLGHYRCASDTPEQDPPT